MWGRSIIIMGFPGGSDSPPAMREPQVSSLGGKEPLQKGMATHSSILAWRMPWTEESDGLQPKGYKESSTTEWLTFSLSGPLLYSLLAHTSPLSRASHALFPQLSGVICQTQVYRIPLFTSCFFFSPFYILLSPPSSFTPLPPSFLHLFPFPSFFSFVLSYFLPSQHALFLYCFNNFNCLTRTGCVSFHHNSSNTNLNNILNDNNNS